MNTNCFTTSKITISTSTYIAQLDTTFDLDIIFSHLKIDNEILGIKYNNKTKGQMKSTGSLFNQLTAIIYLESLKKETNLKVFINGKFQLSGIKNTLQATECIKIFLQKIVDIKGFYLQNVVVEDSIIFNKEDYDNIYTNRNCFDRFNYIKIYRKNKDNEMYEILGKKCKDKYIIDKNYYHFCKDTKKFIDIGHKDFKKQLYDCNGYHVGYYDYEMEYKRKNLILHGCEYVETDEPDTCIIQNKYKNIIGKRTFIKCIEPTYNTERENIVIKYTAIDSQKVIDSIKNGKLFEDDGNGLCLEITNINANFSISLDNKKLNRIAIHNTFVEKYKILSYYKPESKYQAINIKLYYDENLQLLIQARKKYTYKFTATIFQNGKIMLSGCKCKEHIVLIKNQLIKIFNENIEDFIIKEIADKEIVDKKMEELSIWDII